MYDKTTNTLWLQFTGEPVVGPLANSGIGLEMLPVVETIWAEWFASHPGTTVLDINASVYSADRYPSEIDPRSVYFRYREDPDTMFPVWEHSKLLPTKSEVLGVIVDGSPKAYPVGSLLEKQLINDSVGGLNVVIIMGEEAQAARVYQRSNNEFSRKTSVDGTEIGIVDGSGRTWLLTEAALVLEENPAELLSRLPSQMAYWFGWFSYYSNTKVYGLEP